MEMPQHCAEKIHAAGSGMAVSSGKTRKRFAGLKVLPPHRKAPSSGSTKKIATVILVRGQSLEMLNFVRS
jgi:hypothetical protein